MKKHSFNIGLLICITIIMLRIEPREAALFQRSTFEGRNICVGDLSDFAVKTWSSMDKLYTNPKITLEMKECSLYCLIEPKCITYQIVRLENGNGLCYVLYTMMNMVFIDNGICQNFMKQSWFFFVI